MIKRFAIRMAWVILGLILLGMASIWIYVLFNKPEILRKVTAELNSRVKGEVKIEGIDLSFFHSFPDISVRLSTVILRDSLWPRHRHNLLEAKQLYVQLNPFSLFSISPSISKILIEDGSIYLFTDSSGYSNMDIIRPDHSAKKNSAYAFPEIELKNLHLVVDELYRKKLFEFNVGELRCESGPQDSFLQFRIGLAIKVDELSFNTDKGSFLKEKQVAGKITIQFNPSSKVLQFNNIKLQIDQHPFRLTGKFFLGEKPPPFQLSINTEKVLFRTVAGLLPKNIGEKLDKYEILKPISASCLLDGTSTETNDPLIDVKMSVANNSVVTPEGHFSSVSFSGSFTNQVLASQARGDNNSSLRFESFSGQWEGFWLHSKTITITNLEHPLLQVDLQSNFNLSAFNELTGAKSIQFKKGIGKLDLLYRGPLVSTDSLETEINGTIKVNDASIYYPLRNFLLLGCSGTIRFKGQDLYIEGLLANAGSSQLKMYGSAKNLLSLIGHSPEKLILDWNILCRSLDLRDFISFLAKQGEEKTKKNEKSLLVKTGAAIDRLLRDCQVRIQLNANQLIYKKFFGTHLAATLLLSHEQVELENVVLNQAGGSLVLKGSIHNTGTGNALSLQSKMNQVDLPQVFTAFNNFGQMAILDKNLEGKLDADINLSGILSNTADWVPNSISGTIDWSIKNGRLVQFEPLEKISKLVFKNRSFSDIYFAELKDRFQIMGTEIKINRMEIQSSALTLFTEGVYDVKKGADMSIQIPLSNLQSKNQDSIPTNKGIYSKTGISLRLRAKTGDNGKLNVSWDPFRRALKK